MALKQRNGLVQEFDEELWNATVDTVKVNAKGKIRFVFRVS